mmetsp:Transcript_8018/g.23996  ORF Transcript_8018/g.23996 Transcript_8018/m.23996 type:complete len:230 (+) Transcript_8018:525-1214(+)
MSWPDRGLPPKRSSAPSKASTEATWAAIWSLSTERTGPTVRSSRVLDAALSLMSRNSSVFSSQFSWTNRMLCAEHFWPLNAKASWSALAAMYWISSHFCGTSGPRIFQSNPASSSLILPRRSVARSSATLELPVNRVFLGSDLIRSSCMVPPSQLMKQRSERGMPQWLRSLRNSDITTETLVSTLSTGLFPMKRAPMSCSAGISRGKLKGVISATFPKGHRIPSVLWPA